MHETVPVPRRLLTLLALPIALGLVVSACGDGEAPDEPTRTEPPAEERSVEPSEEGSGELALVDTGLDLVEPIDMVAVPGTDDVMFVAERRGRIVQVVTDGTELREVGTVVDISSDVGGTEAERGLLGVAVSDDGSFLYASYTRGTDGASQLDEFRLEADGATWSAPTDSRRALVTVEQPFANHNGGQVVVGPDAALYLGLGDGGAAGDPDGLAQNPDTLLGKLVRIDPAEPSPEPEIWALGLRNPWRFSFDPETDDLWIADVGQDRFEEINRLPGDQQWGRGANLGWDLYEGFEPFEDAMPHPETKDDPLTDPVFVYGRDDGCSVTGGVVYRGEELAGLTGRYLFGDFCNPQLRALRIGDDGTAEEIELGVEHPSLVGFARGPDGEVFVISLDAGIARLTTR